MKNVKRVFGLFGIVFFALQATFASPLQQSQNTELQDMLEDSFDSFDENDQEIDDIEIDNDSELNDSEDNKDMEDLGESIHEQNISNFIKKYNVGSCEVNGMKVPCKELMNDVTHVMKGVFSEFPILNNGDLVIHGFMKFGLYVLFFGLLLSFLGFVFWLWMLIDAIKYQKESRVAWIVVIVFFNVVGALVYLFVAKIGRKALTEKSES